MHQRFAITIIVDFNTCEFLEFAHYYNCVCIEYQHQENTPNLNAANVYLRKSLN